MTVSALLQICNNWFENLDNWKFLGEVVFLVIRKASNSVDYSILLEKVEFMEPLIGNWCGLSPIYKPPDSNDVSAVDGHLSFHSNLSVKFLRGLFLAVCNFLFIQMTYQIA